MLPEKFEKRMKSLLSDEWEDFAAAMDEDSVRGVRINRLKVEPEEFVKGRESVLTQVTYYRDGFYYGAGEAVGTLPEHHAGIFYMQDPGAMASLAAVEIPKGARILDMCAAPGGKSGQAAAAIGDEGFLLSNEYVPKRAKIMVGNFERLGINNAFVTSVDTAEFKKMYRAFFDFVIADVPCSGEGMFRKNEVAISEWSEENVHRCAKRSREILENAAPLVRSGGYIIYSTCTFSTEENEEVVLGFLKEHPEFALSPVRDELKKMTASGASIPGDEDGILAECRRFYPHVSKGEGQFVALLRRDKSNDMPTILYKGKERPLDKSERATVESFLSETLAESINAKPYKVGENIVLISHGVPVPENSVFSSGVLLGEIRKGVLTPHHHFFSAYGKSFKRKLELYGNEEQTRKYLRGEEIDSQGLDGGWCVVTYLGAPLGGGKTVGDRIKNHYPKGLRNK